MNIKKIIILVVVAVVALSHVSDGRQGPAAGEHMRLASIMPRGALLYLQTRDLGALMKMWLASPVRERFYGAKSFAAFSNTRIYLKLQDRKKDFESAIGFGLDEARLAELAGGASAISIYDIGKIEIVFATEIAREKLLATALFKQLPQFQERSADGSSYYVRDVTTDGGRLNQQFCFAHAGGRLIVTTAEGLMIRVLRNARAATDDSLSADVGATIEAASGFAAQDVTMWLDQARLNRNRHFNSYWLHHNIAGPAPGSLAGIESAIINMRFTPQGMNEERWFRMSAGQASATNLSAEQSNALVRLAPANAHLVEIHAGADSEELSDAIAHALFGKMPAGGGVEAFAPDHTRDNSSDDDSQGFRPERYSRLDARFDMDIDDEHSPRKTGGSAGGRAGEKSEPASRKPFFSNVLSRLSSSAYMEIVRSSSGVASPFVKFERAVIVEMNDESALDRAALERALMSEMRERFVVAGAAPELAWRDDGQVRSLSESLLEQGAAYSVQGRYLVMASSAQIVKDCLQAARATTEAARIGGAVEFYALVKVADARPAFDKLMSKLDGPPSSSATGGDQDAAANVKFFSENISGLISASMIKEMRLRRERAGTVMIERVVYTW
jgi:hypothetical protein